MTPELAQAATGNETLAARQHAPAGNSLNLLEFPESAYVGVLAKVADLYSRHYESPKEFFYVDLLALLGNILSGRARAHFGSLPTQPRLYGLKVAKSGWRRKSTSTKLAAKVMRRALELANEQTDAFGGTDVRAGVNVALDYVYTLPGAGSAEGVANALAKNTRVTVIYDEFRRFETKANIEGSVMLPMFNELFDGNEYASPTKDRELHVQNAHLALLSNTTEDGFRALMNSPEMIESGFLNRVFLVVSNKRRKVAIPTDPPEAELRPLLEELAGYLVKLPALNADRTSPFEMLFELTPEASRLWKHFYDNLDETEETTRLDNIGMRLLGLLAFSSGREVIDADLVRAVISILNYQRAVREAYRPVEALSPEAKLEGTILQLLGQKGPMTKRELRIAAHADRYGVSKFDNALGELLSHGRIVQLTVPSKRPGMTLLKYELKSEPEE